MQKEKATQSSQSKNRGSKRNNGRRMRHTESDRERETDRVCVIGTGQLRETSTSLLFFSTTETKNAFHF